MTSLMSVFEIIGSIAFAISGSMLAIKKEMDLFGILILGIVTSVGGGAIRDIVIGNTPPAMFQNPKCTVISSITAMIVFISWKIYIRKRNLFSEKIARRTDIMYHNLLFLSDTLGLAAFTILGMEATISFLHTDQFLLIAFVGLITGVGGGILRDLLAGEIPYVLQKHIYATACIFGIIGYYILYHFMPESAAALIGFCLVLVVRYLAKHFEWNLPR
ncbi:trimeric intracellular cation channel family protein [uncultured Eubacterium sp.]|uniref:trimeric intracellular cation channel family protein n=1 Tax=uncultured Eubacterium sp. TaxID=165185 RepID=UPI0025F209A3|nr:trimeric intracellular cation channel family protein [uncultured Eubacterium sp.]